MNDHSHRWLLILGAGVLGAATYSIYLGIQTRDLKRQFTSAQLDDAAVRAKLSYTERELQNSVDSLHGELSQSRRNADVDIQNAQRAVTRHADIVAQQLAKKMAQQDGELSAELGTVEVSTAEASTRIDGIDTDVGAVKTDVASARSAIDETRSDLQRTRGDLGVMSGLLATNAKGIQELRDLGDRNIYEFTLAKNGKMQKVGEIELTLRKADIGRNRFTLEVVADDKRVEKKDRTVNEPIQFYTSKARQPYELVVNQVEKNQVVGYLATPKVTIARDTSTR